MTDRPTLLWIRSLDGVIAGVAYSPDAPPGSGWKQTAAKVEQGWISDGKGGWMPPGGTVPMVMEITRRQLLIELTTAGLITQQEAIAAATVGAVPAKVEKVILTLAAADQLAARINWATMTVALRNDPLVLALAASEKMDEVAVSAFFARAAAR